MAGLQGWRKNIYKVQSRYLCRTTSYMTKTAPCRKQASRDQIIMVVEGLPETIYKSKEEHDVEAQEGITMEELSKHLKWAEEALKKTRVEPDVSLQANEEMGREVVKKETEIKWVCRELTKAQAFVIEYLMKEEELTHVTTKAKEEVENLRRAQGKYTVEVNSLHRRLKHAKE